VIDPPDGAPSAGWDNDAVIPALPDTRTLPASHPLSDGRTASSPLVRAYHGVRSERTPVWFMRQAGRSLPEYRELRVGTRMLDACLDPQMASEITLQPVRRHGVDAAIFFSDIVIPLRLAGVGVDIVPGKGPVLEHPVRTAADVAALPPLDPDSLAPIAAAVSRTVAELGSTPLIGFAGAPFTLAAYLVEGGPSKDHLAARGLMHADPDAWDALLAWCAGVTGAFLRAQVLAGASAAQLFDSWAGGLSLADYRDRVAPASARALDPVRGLSSTPMDGTEAVTVPLVHFGVGTGELLAAMREVGVDTVGVDWRIPLDEASRRLGGATPVQGNVDPALLSAPWPVLERHLLDVLERGRSAPAHVLNLGHGVPPQTDPDVLTRIVEFVHARA
jgi:uroporphyrinogen decarboxylase